MGYWVFHNNYDYSFTDEEKDTQVRRCNTFWMCFFTTFDWTFKFTGSIGAHIKDPDTIARDRVTDDNNYNGVDHLLVTNFYTRFLFDNLVNIIFVFILLNMIQGIIINTFTKLRGKLQKKIDDQTYICFICGIDREKLDKSDS